jgi:hypothetical protein
VTARAYGAGGGWESSPPASLNIEPIPKAAMIAVAAKWKERQAADQREEGQEDKSGQAGRIVSRRQMGHNWPPAFTLSRTIILASHLGGRRSHDGNIANIHLRVSTHHERHGMVLFHI